MANDEIRRKVFVSFHHSDEEEAEQFVVRCYQQRVFIPRMLNASYSDEIINSSNADYVMSQVRSRYLADTTVTLVLIGRCTHSRRYIDWEIKSSLRQGSFIPNGLLAVILPSAHTSVNLPYRFTENWQEGEEECYARLLEPPLNANQLARAIEDAYYARQTRARLIRNTTAMMKYNSRCRACGITH
jgi:hypothetical protein